MGSAGDLNAAGRAVALAVALWGGAAAAAKAPEPTLEVPPGSLVRWQAPGTELCGLEGRRWRPTAGACWFPIDLLTPAGPVELARWRGGRQEIARVRVGPYPYPVQSLEIEDRSRVDLSATDLERARRERRQVEALWEFDTPPRFDLPLAPPLEPMPAGGRFGARRIFNGQLRSPHTGADYPAPAGTPVKAAAPGTVALAAEHFFAGRSVFLDHGGGLITMYFHLSEILVQVGQTVERGGVIGRVGESGRATGPHLHFGVRWRGARVDPDLLFRPLAGVPTLP